jgi:hypothetical protein
MPIKIKKISFEAIEATISKEESKLILGGAINNSTLDEEASGDSAGGGNYSQGGFGLTGFGQGSFVSGSANNFGQLGSYNNASNSSGGSSNSGTNNLNSSSSSNSYTNGWNYSTGGNMTTNDQTAISRYFQFMYLNNGTATNDQINSFVTNEMTVNGRLANDTLYGGMLKEVIVTNNYKRPSGIPYEMVFNSEGVLEINNSYYGVGTTNEGNINGSNYNAETWSKKPTDCVFQCMAQIGAFYGNNSFSFEAMKANYDSIYKTANTPGSIEPAAMGVNEILFSNFVDQYFNRAPITTTSQLDTFITAGGDNFAIGVIRKYSADGASSTLHAVVLTKLEGNGYRYTDPQKVGIEGTVNKNDLVNFVAITGICN